MKWNEVDINNPQLQVRL